MMRHVVVFWILLSAIRNAEVQAQTAVWKFPTQGQGFQANIIDTVLLDWTSTLPSTILQMWCKNGTHQALISSFFVDSTGPLKYVMETYEHDEKAFPLSCHAELAADPTGSGFDSQAEIVWSSNTAQAAKTISQTNAVSSVALTAISKLPSSLTRALIPPSSETSAPPSSTTNANQSQASATGSAKTDSPSQPTTVSTKSSEGPSGATAASQTSSSASTSSSAASSTNNAGAVVGGTIGCVALVSFTIAALLFLRKYQRDRASSTPSATEPSNRSFYVFNVYKKLAPKVYTSGTFEKEDNCGVYEKEGDYGWSV